MKPNTAEEILQVKMTTRLNQGLLAVEDAVIALKTLPVAEANTPARDAIVKQLRQTALDMGGTATQMRMALERGAAVADKVFSPTAGYEGLSAEQIKMLKELDKEKEKEEQTKRQQALQETQTSSSRGGYVQRPYNRGQGYYRPYFNPYQQYGGGGQGQQHYETPAAAPQVQQQGYQQQHQFNQQQQYGQVQQQFVPATQQQAASGQQQQQFAPMGQQQFVRSQRPDPRAQAFCYGCGEVGHYARDNACRPGASAAFKAKLQQQVAAGVQGVQQPGPVGPDPGLLAAITYTGPAPPTNG